MRESESTSRPDWVSDDLYPFESRFFLAPPDHRMHYIDEGAGDPLVFVHGNPAWSFEFRHVIRELRSEFRCVAPDHVGFGLSSRSARREDHHPESHARRFAAFLDHLGLRDITLFMTDWGGPIGLDFARRHPERVRRLVIANSWCWPVGDDFHFRAFSFLMSSWIGQYLIRHRNMFVNKVMPKAVGDPSILTPEVMAHYRNAQPSPAARAANAALPGYIVSAGDWLGSIWGRPRGLCGQAGASSLGLQGYCVPSEGTRTVEGRAAEPQAARIPGLRAFPGGRSAQQGRIGAASLHGAHIVSVG